MTVAIKERPILFSGPMVRAILDGRKTQTRRPVKPQPPEGFELQGPDWYHPTVVKRGKQVPGEQVFGVWEIDGDYGFPSPYGAPGDRLYVRETFAVEGGVSTYFADNDWISVYNRENPGLAKRRWTPSIHMPKWASRINLEIEDVWLERVQDISEEDAIAEGFPIPGGMPTKITITNLDGSVERSVGTVHDFEARTAFSRVWDSIYGNWAANPWVWAYKFRRV